MKKRFLPSKTQENNLVDAYGESDINLPLSRRRTVNLGRRRESKEKKNFMIQGDKYANFFAEIKNKTEYIPIPMNEARKNEGAIIKLARLDTFQEKIVQKLE